MPYKNYHGCLVNGRATNILGTEERTISEGASKGKKYMVKYARPPGKSSGSVERSYLYPKGSWGAAAARAHCKGHGGTFEPAQDLGSTQQFENDYDPEQNPMIPKTDEGEE